MYPASPGFYPSNVPPDPPVIKDLTGNVLRGLIGPYDEGDPLQLICDVTGGKPPPHISWWHRTADSEAQLLDDSYEVASGGHVRNRLELPELARRHLLAVLVCRASNNNMSLPLETSVTLDLNLRPSEVSIETDFNPLLAGREVNVSCVTRGSRPSAVLTWWKGGARLADTGGGAAGRSTLRLRPHSSDGGQWLVCRAANPALPGRGAEDARRMEVHFPPEVELRLTSHDSPQVREGSDVRLECRVRSSPPASGVQWRVGGRELAPSAALHLASNTTLLIRQVPRSLQGSYTCRAGNPLGEAESGPVDIRVQYAPSCRPPETARVGAGLHEAVKVTCEVEADPAEVTFYWAVAAGRKRAVDRAEPADGLRSVATYVPRSERDYGRLLCWAVNVLGGQRRPCEFHVVPAGPPRPVKGCQAGNVTVRGFSLRCLPGDDGGLPQKFSLEVFAAGGPGHACALSGPRTESSLPEFHPDGLQPSTAYLAVVTAVNARGRSRSVVFRVLTALGPTEAPLDGNSSFPQH
ncbi:hypothetical protein LAZ67_2002439 [Cordylochernes scorpioides]|uniref:Nephrin n=1 Tax=Cordylochernes scorpioides TaxID=51811 RepID=A0ABY6K294_9ARAC|nr:hypothetical protein LAZ67_2002439 [Cordylochernes scorpioides]